MSANGWQLSVDDVEAVYEGAILALRRVSFQLARGEMVALLGANGAGKTTSLMAVCNLLRARRGAVTRGTIHFEGNDIRSIPTARLVAAGVVMVLEGRHCFPALTIEENLVTGALGKATRAGALRDGLERIYGLFPALRNKRRLAAGLASGGEQQMTAIGRALMARPRLLVLDEPSMGLAPLVVEDIFKRLRALNRSEGLSILFAEQNATIALRYADRGYVLRNGEVVLEGSAAALRERDDIRHFYLGLDPAAKPESDPPAASGRVPAMAADPYQFP